MISAMSPVIASASVLQRVAVCSIVLRCVVTHPPAPPNPFAYSLSLCLFVTLSLSSFLDGSRVHSSSLPGLSEATQCHTHIITTGMFTIRTKNHTRFTICTKKLTVDFSCQILWTTHATCGGHHMGDATRGTTQ